MKDSGKEKMAEMFKRKSTKKGGAKAKKEAIAGKCK